MSNYFGSKGNQYFAPAKTSTEPTNAIQKLRKGDPILDAENRLETAIKSYGLKKSSVVIRRYGIK